MAVQFGCPSSEMNAGIPATLREYLGPDPMGVVDYWE